MITWQTDLAAARVLAAQQNKIVLMVFCRTGCAQCDAQYRIMDSPKVQPSIDEKFVCFKSLVPYPSVPASDLYWTYCKGLVGSFPAFVAVTPSMTPGNNLTRWSGLMLAKIFVGQLAKVVALAGKLPK